MKGFRVEEGFGGGVTGSTGFVSIGGETGDGSDLG